MGADMPENVKVQRVVAEKVLRIDRPVGPEGSHV